MAHHDAGTARRRRATGPAPSLTGPASDVHPVLRRTTAPPAALDLLAQARAGLEEAAVLETPNERYATAHLAALRTAAAVLAARGRPEQTPRRRARIRSAWEVLPEIAPELDEWSALFASGADRRARAEAASEARPPPRRGRPDTRRRDVPPPRRADAGAAAGAARPPDRPGPAGPRGPGGAPRGVRVPRVRPCPAPGRAAPTGRTGLFGHGRRQ